MKTLVTKLQRLNNNSYPLYKAILGSYDAEKFSLTINSIQPDPFAPPSKATLKIPFNHLGLGQEFIENPVYKRSLCDVVARILAQEGRRICTEHKGSGNSGLFGIRFGHQKVIDSNAVLIRNGVIEARILIGLPAFGRKIASREAITFLNEEISSLVDELCSSKYHNRFQKAAELLQRQVWLRELCKKEGLIAFVGNNSVLPRKGGTDTALEGAIAFASPKEWEKSFTLPDGFTIKGMAIPKGITLIVGGGYHGKSTLLAALSQGIYNHILGDGREYCLTTEDAVFLRSEDGRPVSGTDISDFIHDLPGGKNSSFFETDSASGSSSQATNLMESLEAGAQTFLIDEDTSATNFLMRDDAMRALVPENMETITPLAAALPRFKDAGISLIMISGALGGLLGYADRVILAQNYRYLDSTSAARKTSALFPNHTKPLKAFIPKQTRVINGESINFLAKKGKPFIDGMPKMVKLGRNEVDLSLWQQLVDYSQYGTIATIIAYAKNKGFFNKTPQEYLQLIWKDILEQDWDTFSEVESESWRYIVAVRPVDVHAAICRIRKLECYPITEQH
ncbi:MAG: P-loop domain-containing protein [Brevinema sp.]